VCRQNGIKQWFLKGCQRTANEHLRNDPLATPSVRTGIIDTPDDDGVSYWSCPGPSADFWGGTTVNFLSGRIDACS
jgi:hypothetical protein